ncbi:DUF2065 domain-containing protein [Chthonobacter albigriseus]|uniref:DUF2065 domain-containing protein n=1 Tax=Chthonobacter albigriseus TaxID=1683161 RepID=UPI0015EF78AD|nr:DUF2065 domain-containing protein [Chthonobacter albigriseus]
MNDFVAALGLVAVIEGVLYAAAPALMKKGLREIIGVPEATLRIGGIAAMTVGVIIVWLARS